MRAVSTLLLPIAVATPAAPARSTLLLGGSPRSGGAEPRRPLRTPPGRS